MSFIYADAISHRIVDAVADRKLNSLKTLLSVLIEVKTKCENCNY